MLLSGAASFPRCLPARYSQRLPVQGHGMESRPPQLHPPAHPPTLLRQATLGTGCCIRCRTSSGGPCWTCTVPPPSASSRCGTCAAAWLPCSAARAAEQVPAAALAPRLQSRQPLVPAALPAPAPSCHSCALQAASPHMRDAGKRELAAGGRPRPRCILNVSSVSGASMRHRRRLVARQARALAERQGPACTAGHPALHRAPPPRPWAARSQPHPRLTPLPLATTPLAGVHGSVGQANYATAKAGVVGLTKAVAREWGPFGVRCNALVFGYINTRWVGRWGARKPEQRAAGALDCRTGTRLPHAATLPCPSPTASSAASLAASGWYRPRAGRQLRWMASEWSWASRRCGG